MSKSNQLTRHTCGGPVYGRITPGCPRCDERANGAKPRSWGGQEYEPTGSRGRALRARSWQAKVERPVRVQFDIWVSEKELSILRDAEPSRQLRVKHDTGVTAVPARNAQAAIAQLERDGEYVRSVSFPVATTSHAIHAQLRATGLVTVADYLTHPDAFVAYQPERLGS